ncbi:hypothetical protein EYF80_034360 [Liparis tanakae]|uniref:Uncharacterized protein n=1 Tax=Liparis tanakae TaxID=230148 RepID=A0A4Z2GQA2_9TELE|nr:hypothetical protein EYF80_034360 [Liparis tanakae]
MKPESVNQRSDRALHLGPPDQLPAGRHQAEPLFPSESPSRDDTDSDLFFVWTMCNLVVEKGSFSF